MSTFLVELETGNPEGSRVVWGFGQTWVRISGALRCLR